MVFLAAIGDVGAPQVDLDHDLRGDGRPTKLSGVFRNVFADAGATSIVAPADGSRPQRLADVPVTYHLRYVHTDALGSPVVETNAIGEEITGTRTLYEPYGTPLTTPRDGAPSYTGHQYDTGTGLIYAQQRYYDPQLGVFYSPDPMAVDTTSAFNFNRYAYANNSPYKFTDPDGREVIAPNAVQRQTLASLISRKSSSAFSFGDDGKLKQAEGDNGSGGKSEYYASRLNEAIASERKIYVVGMKEYKGIDVVNEGGITQASPDGDAAVIVSALPVNLETMSDPVDPANVLAHELVGHAIPHAVGGGSGNAVKEDNIVREQNGDPPRPAEPDHCSTCEHMP